MRQLRLEEKRIQKKMNAQAGHITLFLLVSDELIRAHLWNLLKKSEYPSRLVFGLDELLEGLKGQTNAIVFLDADVVSIYGPAIYSKIRAVVHRPKIILLCDRKHRDLIKEAMELGVYGCILEPYAEWEVLTIVKHVQSDIQPRKRKPARKKKKM